MIQSMTGYGRVEFNLKNKNFTVEIKSLNSKTTDFNLKLPVIYRNKEIILRKILSEKLKRGKVELSIWFEKTQTNTPYEFDKKLILKYYKQLNSIKQLQIVLTINGGISKRKRVREMQLMTQLHAHQGQNISVLALQVQLMKDLDVKNGLEKVIQHGLMKLLRQTPPMQVQYVRMLV